MNGIEASLKFKPGTLLSREDEHGDTYVYYWVPVFCTKWPVGAPHWKCEKVFVPKGSKWDGQNFFHGFTIEDYQATNWKVFGRPSNPDE